jgi:hypothetical protein
MEWLASQLPALGANACTCFTEMKCMPLGDDICVGIDGDPQKVDVIYRFWELFDLANVSIADFLLRHAKQPMFA